MSKVHILPPEIISKIAAGEVIERPASAIKELIENSLDAQTTSLELELQQAGKMSIRLKDSGMGITRDDMEKIFHRHATSKIETLDDLFDIHSLGFRGEALYSIAAVADILLRSKTMDQDTGWEIHVRGGDQLNFRPVSMPPGTEVIVKELFFNTPARRKFLKSNTTEMNQILNILIPYTLLYPPLHFSLKHQNKKVLELFPTDALLPRIEQSLNLNEKHLIDVAQEFPENALSVRMILGDINIVRSRRDMQFIFVNNRPVQSKSIGYHLNNVYRLILPSGHYPFFAVFIHLPAQDVDVNIHPTKREVKIKGEQTLCAVLRQMCEITLMNQGQAKEVVAIKKEKQAEPDTITKALSQTSQVETAFDRPADWEPHSQKTSPQSPTEQYSFPTQSATAERSADYFPKVSENLFGQKQAGLKHKLSRAGYIGSFLNKFLFFESAQTLLVIDQHAAQERITFEQLVRQMEKGKVEIQHLLSPYLIKLAPQEMNIWEEVKKQCEEIGFENTLLDNETIAVHTYPVLIKDPQKAVRDILSGYDAARCDHESLARRACRASIMAGNRLNPQQAEFQREQLLQCKDPFTCPHGRPTIIEMSESFLNKQFLRT